jgi:hypothetical protein
MAERLLQYVLLICLPIIILWLIGRLLHVPRARDSRLAYFSSHLDAHDAFDQALMKHRWRQLAAVLMRQQDRLRLASLDDVATNQPWFSDGQASRPSRCTTSLGPYIALARPLTESSDQPMKAPVVGSRVCTSRCGTANHFH